ncbi:MAG: sigma-54-dependent Fis family transcriptional regulator [Polyangiaceae bacterium]|nr:sigma-54-dependent Fis family transcriptional regulator [Polyangiaceae bacterium]
MSKSNSDTQSNPLLSWGQYRQKIDRDVLHLAIAWSCDEPRRIGEVAAIMEPCILGRGLPPSDDSVPRTLFHQQRPVEPGRMAPLDGPHVSRRQLELTPLRDGTLKVRSLSRRPLILHGEIVERGVVRPGDTVTVQDVLVLLVVQRRCRRPTLPICSPVPVFPFGEADAYGIVGESSAAWALREAIAFAASSGKHVLVLGESGVGKELAARAIHALSPQCGGPFVARNAATFPEGLVDAELFGTARGFPNAGSPERRGLIAEADGGTLFLDEIGELPPQLQVHLLRVLDRGGEYQRLGEARTRRSSFRLVAATNRPADALKHDLCARFTLRVEVPGLGQRREDVPLLLQHLLARVARATPALAARYFEQRAGGVAEARVDGHLVEALLQHRFSLHTRELERLMWVALGTSPGDVLTLTPELRAAMKIDETAPERASAPSTDPRTVGRAEIEAALAAVGGSITEAARELGLKNRFVLYRLMKRLGMVAPEDDPSSS